MNPFRYGTVVQGPYFFDRDKEKRKIVDVVKGGNNLVLYSPRRYGKTSLIMNVINTLKRQGFDCIYYDFMTAYSIDSFIESYTRAVFSLRKGTRRLINYISKFIKGLRPRITFGSDGSPEFCLEFLEPEVSDETLESVIDLPAKLTGNKRLIIVMDEFQDIHKLDGENFERILRSRIQHHSSVSYVFLGSRTHILRDMFNDESRPFYNSALPMNLGPLPRDETVRFLKERFAQSNIEVDTETAEYLITQAGNVPYYIQFLALEVWQYSVNNVKRVTAEIIDLCADRIVELKGDYYYELFDRLSAYQKKLLKALAQEGKNIFSANYARKYRLSVPSTTQKAIAGLVNYGIVEKVGNAYYFDDPFFKKYVLRLSA